MGAQEWELNDPIHCMYKYICSTVRQGFFCFHLFTLAYDRLNFNVIAVRKFMTCLTVGNCWLWNCCTCGVIHKLLCAGYALMCVKCLKKKKNINLCWLYITNIRTKGLVVLFMLFVLYRWTDFWCDIRCDFIELHVWQREREKEWETVVLFLADFHVTEIFMTVNY